MLKIERERWLNIIHNLESDIDDEETERRPNVELIKRKKSELRKAKLESEKRDIQLRLEDDVGEVLREALKHQLEGIEKELDASKEDADDPDDKEVQEV